jgi:hypothetical protein
MGGTFQTFELFHRSATFKAHEAIVYLENATRPQPVAHGTTGS